ncbi:polyprenyl synthetase family protein [Verrucomicrobium spinosum]|uniref:polyprenyl synthetase family protein n=1 Tax=Verrucomicrobium spinosum TaxID=2736 RepID=UPI002109C30F|nr:polyprenyl synthetase family protein [Verrucomicrobium spinosum]
MTHEHRQLSIILEMIHIASLVHDDIMDGATIRREMPTAAAKWGNASAYCWETASSPTLSSWHPV